MVEEAVDRTHTRVFLVTQEVSQPEVYVAPRGALVFIDFMKAWEYLLSPAWGNRVILTKSLQMVDLKVAKNVTDTLFSHFLRNATMEWRLMVPEDITIISMENALNGEFFSSREMEKETSWFSKMVQELVKLHGLHSRNAPTRGSEFDTNELRSILEMLPGPLYKYLTAFLLNMKHARDVAEGETTKLQKEVSRLRKEFLEYKAGMLTGVRLPPPQMPDTLRITERSALPGRGADLIEFIQGLDRRNR
jgi:hypothetical protein